jgi:hypothetical protein
MSSLLVFNRDYRLEIQSVMLVQGYVFIQCITEGGMGPQRDKLLPPNPFTGRFLRKDDLLGFGVFIKKKIYSYLVHASTALHCYRTSKNSVYKPTDNLSSNLF